MGRKLDALFGRKFRNSRLKTAVNLAISRLAILKNHRRARFTIAHSDLVQLLHLNHHQQALLRVEQVIKDQNMLLVYDMIHEHCLLLKQSVNLIEQAINCPEELKEAVSSLLYAAPRCGEFPELQEIRSILTARFGKEFVESAIELKNNSRVCHKMIQKLSSKELSLEWRMIVLKGIAKENGIVLQLQKSSPEIIRVEEVIKDQNMLLVYDMIHEHCLLLKQSVNLLEQATNCPEELKEAVSSLLYAAPRCGEFPELQEIRWILTKRFGKEFVDSAIELRSNSRVCQSMIQKLSSKELSLEWRVMVLTGIAKENGIVLQLEKSSPEIIKEKLVYEKISNQLSTEGIALSERTVKVLSLSESMKRYRDVEHAAQDAFESAAYAAAAAKMAVQLSRLESFHSDDFHSANARTTNVFDSSSRYDSEPDYKEIIEEDEGERSTYNRRVEDLYPDDYSDDDGDMKLFEKEDFNGGKYKIEKEKEGLPSRNAYFSSYKPFPFRHQA